MKRTFDISVIVLSSIIMVPIIILLILIIYIKHSGHVFFTQTRPGLNGQPFKMVKFRTMTDDRNKDGTLLSDAERLTPFGRWLRASSLDELPELWNVLRGEMSLVGPRPLLMEYLPLYTTEQVRRHDMRPGITGWAQVNGRNAISWEEKFKLDAWYVDNQSFWLDIKILWLTVKKVLMRDGISAEGEATMSKFMGKSDELK